MSDEVKKGHEKFFQRPIDGGFIWPLPLELPDEAELEHRSADPNIIMSVGRITPFKTYNAYMVDVITELRAKHPRLKWVVYGFGPDEARLLGENHRLVAAICKIPSLRALLPKFKN